MGKVSHLYSDSGILWVHLGDTKTFTTVEVWDTKQTDP